MLSFSDASRLHLGKSESKFHAREPRNANRYETGREAPMIITPAALLRLLRRIVGRS
jgi:hypothetical protein